MYQRILVPIDGSDTSQHALLEALKLGDSSAQLRLVHVSEEIYALDAEGYAYIDYAVLREAVHHSGERLLEQAAKKVEQEGRKAETALLETDGERIPNVIAEDAKRWQADVIVIGTHSRSGLSRLLLGSVAEGVARVAAVPVLLVRG